MTAGMPTHDDSLATLREEIDAVTPNHLVGRFVEYPIGNERVVGVVRQIDEKWEDDGDGESGPRPHFVGLTLMVERGETSAASPDEIDWDPDGGNDEIRLVGIGEFVTFSTVANERTIVGRIVGFARTVELVERYSAIIETTSPTADDANLEGPESYSVRRIERVVGADLFHFDDRWFETIEDAVDWSRETGCAHGEVFQVLPPTPRPLVVGSILPPRDAEFVADDPRD